MYKFILSAILVIGIAVPLTGCNSKNKDGLTDKSKAFERAKLVALENALWSDFEYQSKMRDLAYANGNEMEWAVLTDHCTEILRQREVVLNQIRQLDRR